MNAAVSFRPPRFGAGGTTAIQLAAVALVAALAGVFSAASGSAAISVGGVVVLGLAILGLVRPAAFIAVFVFARPLLDSATDKKIGIGFASVNAAGLLAVLLIAIFAVTAASQREIVWPKATKVLGLVVAVSFVAFIEAKRSWLDPFMGSGPLAELTRIIAMYAIYLLAANFMNTPERIRRLFTLVALAALVPAFVGLLQLVGLVGTTCEVCTESTQELGLQRINGTFVGPNAFGVYLALSMLVVLGLPQAVALPPRVRLAILGVLTITLVGTYSREAWAMALIGVVILFWKRRKSLMVGIGVAVVAAVMLVPSINERVIPSKETTAVGPAGVSQFSSYSWRLETWRIVGEKIKERPLRGYGLGSEAYLLPPLGAPEGTKGYEPHNLALTTLLQGGVLLLLAWSLFFFVILKRLRTLAHRRWRYQEHARLLGVLWILVIVVGLSAGNMLSETATMFALFALTGAIEGARAREPRAPSGTERHAIPGGTRT